MPSLENCRIRAFFPSVNIACVAVDVTAAAQTLERAHLAGPVAGRALGEALAAVAILGAETAQPEETVSFRLIVPGPLGGLLAEATAEGTLRGYTTVKVIDALDGLTTPPADAEVLGAHAEAQIIRSVPGTVISRGAVMVKPASVGGALAAYFEQSLQRRVTVVIRAESTPDAHVARAFGFAIECMPDGDVAAYDGIVAAVAGMTPAALSECSHDVARFCEAVGLRDGTFQAAEPLRFACRCSHARAAAMIEALAEEERAGLANPAHIICHMCGADYSVAW